MHKNLYLQGYDMKQKNCGARKTETLAYFVKDGFFIQRLAETRDQFYRVMKKEVQEQDRHSVR